MDRTVNILIVHYNTPYLTRHLVKSIKKHTPNSKIYIFDNSDAAPFDTYGLKDVTVFDNTKGQYINFDEWLKKFPNKGRSNGRINGWGSAKHCVSVEKCMSLISDGFILLDSDVLVKKDISPLFRPDKIYVGEVINQPSSTIKRVLPYICYINVSACKKNNVHYFDENRMHGLMYNRINKDADSYDTGAAFYLNCKNLPAARIKTEEYVEHYSGASWKEVKKRKINYKFTPKQWIEKNYKCWSDNDMEKMKNKNVVYTCITGNYESLDDPFVISEGFDYVCFTNCPDIKSDVWQMRPIPKELDGLSEVKKQRIIKICPHKYLPEYELSIWVDGSVKLLKDLNQFIDEQCSGEENVYIPQHPARNCIYDEMKECIKLRKDTEAHIEPQRKRYEEEGFPKKYGLVQSNIVIRRHNKPDCVKLMNTWAEELKKGSHRDQLSFDYARWRNKDVKVKFIDKKTCNSAFFKWDPSHGKNKKKHTTPKTNVSTSISEILERNIEPKRVAKPKKPPIPRITTKNPKLKAKLISHQLKVFLKP